MLPFAEVFIVEPEELASPKNADLAQVSPLPKAARNVEGF
jgi:hypothetical protein